MRATSSILPLRVAGLCFEAESRRLVEGLTFDLPRGGVTMVLGANGAGKSLTLRLSHGLLRPSAGQIRWAAGDGAPHGRKRHAMVFQRPVMLRRSVRDNLLHALRAVGADDPIGRCGLALERFGLVMLAQHPARLLSGGEQQRLAIARAWSLEPELLFLDEPTSQLDPGAARQIELIIAALAAEGMTIVQTTHDLGQARRLGQRVMFLHRGQLVEDRDTEGFFTNPASAEAKAFLSGDLLW